MASGFRSSARGGSFRNRSAGDSGLDQERQKTRQVVSGLKEQRNAYSKIHGDKIAGLERVNNLEEEKLLQESIPMGIDLEPFQGTLP